jgi:hypothetical protein
MLKGPIVTGLDCAGLDCAGSDCAGSDSVGPDLAVLDQTCILSQAKCVKILESVTHIQYKPPGGS